MASIDSYAGRAFGLLRGPGLMILARIGGAFAAMLLTAMLTRSLGPEGAGQVATAMALSMVLALACSLNIEAGGVRFMVQDLARGNAAAVTGYVRFARRFVALVSIAVVPLALVVVWRWHGAVSAVLLLAVLTAPVLGWLRLGGGIALGLSRPVLSVLPRTLLRPVFMAMLIGLWLLIAGPLSPFVAMVLFLATAILTLAAQSWLLHASLREIETARGAAPRDMGQTRDWVRTGLTLGLNVLFLEYSVYLTVLAAAPVLTMEETARLDVALKIMALARFATQAIGQYYSPAMSRAIAVQDTASLSRTVAVSALLRLAVGLGVLGLILPFGGTVLGVFGPAFAGDGWLLVILAGDIVAEVVFGQGITVVSLAKRPMLLLPVLAATLVTLVAGSMIGGALWGLAGVGAAAVAARMVWVACGAWLAWRLTGINTTLAGLPANLRAGRRPSGGN